MKFLSLLFCKDFNSEQILCFIKFLKSSKIQFLNLNSLYHTQGFDDPEFVDFLRNSDSLLGLNLINSNSNILRLNLLLQALSFNKNIQILFLRQMNLNDFSSSLVNLISTNNTISTLVLIDRTLRIDTAFIDALLESKSILYLILYDCIIKDDNALKLSKSKIKGINIDNLFICQSTKNEIYTSIPRIEYSNELLEYEKFIRPSN